MSPTAPGSRPQGPALHRWVNSEHSPRHVASGASSELRGWGHRQETGGFTVSGRLARTSLRPQRGVVSSRPPLQHPRLLPSSHCPLTGGSCPALRSGHSVGSRRWSAGQVTAEKDSPPPRLEPTPPRAQPQGAPLFSEHPAPRVPPGESHADRGAGLCLGGARGKQTRRASGGGQDGVTECTLSLQTWNQRIWTWDSM